MLFRSRGFFLDEIVRSIDALSRDQFYQLVHELKFESVMIPVLLPGATKRFTPLAPQISEEDAMQVESVAKLVAFLSGGDASSLTANLFNGNSQLARDVLPLLPRVVEQLLPEIVARLSSRVVARMVREYYL